MQGGTVRGRSRAVVIAIGVALAVNTARAGLEDPALSITIASRSIQPGELVVLTLALKAEPTRVVVRAFDRVMPAYTLRAGVWQALVGIDLERKPGAYDVDVEARIGASTVRGKEVLVVQRRTFPTRRLRVDPNFVNPSAAVLARIASEAAFLKEVTGRSAEDRLWSMPFVRPVPDEANSRFGTRSVFNGEARRPHGGTDFLSAAGTPVRAPNAGRVAAARELFFTGNTVIIDHGMGVVSLLAHLSSVDVREGEAVSAGQIVGRVGATGRVTGPHLHWALTVAGARVDPLSALALLGGDVVQAFRPAPKG
jgi:murein DD-endopeptidase MepM/ murein hydrolase activator NlpD